MSLPQSPILDSADAGSIGIYHPRYRLPSGSRYPYPRSNRVC